MPLLQSTQTQTANGAPLYIPADGAGNAVVPGSLVVKGGVTGNDFTANPSATTSINLGLAGGFPSIAFTNGATQTLIGLQSPAGPILVGNNQIDVVVPHDLSVTETLTALSLGGAWAGTTVPTLPFGGIPLNTTGQAGNIKLGNTRVQWGVANITFTAGSGAIVVPFASAFSSANFVTFLTGAFGNAGNLPVTLQASPSTTSAFTVNAAVGAVGDSGNYEFQWMVLGPVAP